MGLVSDKLTELMGQQVAVITKQVTKQVTEQVTEKVQRLLALVEQCVPHLSSIPTPPPEIPTRENQPPPPKEKALTGQKTKGKGKKKKEGKGTPTPPLVPPQQVGPPPPPPKKEKRGAAPLLRKATLQNQPPPPPPSATHQLDTPFSKVVGRKEKRRQAFESRDQLVPTKGRSQLAQKPQPPPIKEGSKKKNRRRRPPTTAAVTVTAPEGSYSQVMARAKKEIPLENLGISAIKSRRGQTGALILEIGGPDNKDKANRLAQTMATLFATEEGVRITCPTKMAELRLSGLDPDTVDTEEILSSVARVGECSPTDIKVGEIRPNARGKFTAWVKCPLRAANKIATPARIQFSAWCVATVALLLQCPLQCYKCLEVGHVRACCPNNNIDRSGTCYRCGKEGHPARMCTASAHCVICASAGKQASHRMGGPACKPPKRGARGGKGGRARTAPAPLPQRQPRPIKSGDPPPPRRATPPRQRGTYRLNLAHQESGGPLLPHRGTHRGGTPPRTKEPLARRGINGHGSGLVHLPNEGYIEGLTGSGQAQLPNEGSIERLTGGGSPSRAEG